MSSAPPANQDALIAELSSLTGLAPTQAEQFLNAGNWDIQTAAALYFDEQAPEGEGEAEAEDDDMADDEPQNPTPNPPQQPQRGGGRTLAGDYVPPSESSSSTSRQPQRGLRTLGDLQSSSGGGRGHGHSHDDDNDPDDEDEENQDFFAGGEKSGLAVQNPNQNSSRDQINNILRRARQNIPRPDGDDDEQPVSRFRGTGMTLGGDDAPSRPIPDPNANTNANIPPPAPRASRELHLWRDGFSVDDGPLFRYDDPNNARTLEMINTGHAPLHILNVQQGQEVDVQVHAHKDEDYVKPKKKYVPFSGTGQRLGSPTPGGSAFAPPPAAAATSSTTQASASPAAPPTVDVDSSAPTVTLRIQLGDGTRLTSRFNTTHTLGDVYGFVDRASPASTGRAYVLATTFPTKELTDKAAALGDIDSLKRGGNVVQKWA
ncbi:SEP-domain-containing protein [Byssothecium circinans]|uniref:SEP-domain-containing protein n=1 Tax=Byssothecium circinans TaxID=147558 RepID=A0A6A5UC13_9PLEO|nr:SEP-domain-containing protein [Byssothecium circinans]